MSPKQGKRALGNAGLWKLLDPLAAVGEAQTHISPTHEGALTDILK